MSSELSPSKKLSHSEQQALYSTIIQRLSQSILALHLARYDTASTKQRQALEGAISQLNAALLAMTSLLR